MMGQLNDGQKECLESRMRGGESQTIKGKVSIVLITDAYNRKDQNAWSKLVKRHLEKIDRSDPDICFTYALHLAKKGTSRAREVIKWADTALENKHRWSGNTYKSRLFNLYKLKAYSASKLWEAAEKELLSAEVKADPAKKSEVQAKAERYRGQAKDFAREWLDYARASGQSTSQALQLCVSAAGEGSACEG